MKVNWLNCIIFITTVLAGTHINAAINKQTYPDMPTRQYVFIENNNDDNYFVTPGVVGQRDPRMTGSNRWTGLKYNGSGYVYQQSLGYIDNGYNTGLYAGWMFDMWLDNSPASYPLLGLRCINWYTGCDMNTSLIPPQATDEKGFYGVKVTPGGAKWMHGMMADSFYQFLQQVPVGGSFSTTINTCTTSVQYDASSGARCKDQATGVWSAVKVTHQKGGHLKLENTNALTEIFINSDGVPIIGDGNGECRTMNIGTVSGLGCKMVKYNLQSNGINNIYIHIFPAINNPSLLSAINFGDVQFSLDGNSWRVLNGTASYYTYNELTSSDSIYIFFSSNFFKQMVRLEISDMNTAEFLNFRFYNADVPESGWYEFSTSSELIIKPRDFGVSIISDEYTSAPKKEGYVGFAEPSLDFGYIVTTSAKTAADEVLIKVKGPSKVIRGVSYCLFSSPDDTVKVAFPATLSFTAQDGKVNTWSAGCDDTWHDMTNALWTATPWNDISGDVGLMNKANVKFSILMNNPISLRTIERDGWFGEVSASGEIHVQATWRDIN